MSFEYFRYPEKFASMAENPEPCSVCGEAKKCFDAGGYSGIRDIDFICADCLKAGKLIELDIEANLNFDDGSEAAKTITYRTPALPTWQDTAWPMIDGRFPIFECIASKEDFKDRNEFLDSFIEDDQTKADIEWVWNSLPSKKLNSYKDGGDVSVYLFTLDSKKYWIWDAS
ncbi:MAG: CbrC family protein [Pseudomonadota bacterium]|nr:CbrC family protein [Pseudomonadota bacterium]